MPSMTPEQRVAGVRALLEPRNIAIVGASDRPGNWSMRVFNSLRRSTSLARSIRSIRATRRSGTARPVTPSLADLPEPPDHVVVIVPGAAAIDAIVEAGEDFRAQRDRLLRRLWRGRRSQGARARRAAQERDRERRARGVGPELPRQSGGARPPDDHPRRSHRRTRAWPGRHCRPERRHRDGDPPGAARARRHPRLCHHQRQRNRPAHGRLHPLSRATIPTSAPSPASSNRSSTLASSKRLANMRVTPASRSSRSRLAAPKKAARRRLPIPARSRARCKASTRWPRRSAWCASIRSTRWWRRSSISRTQCRRRDRASAP